MNKEQFKGQWNQIKGKVKEQWGKLTDDDLTFIDGKREQLVGALQKRYGKEKEAIENELKKFERQYEKRNIEKLRDVDEDLESSQKYGFEEDEEKERRRTGTEG